MTFPILPASNPSSGGYTLSKSLRFRSSASAYLNRTATSGNTQKWTWSGWVKRGILGSASTGRFFGAGVSGSGNTGIVFGFGNSSDDYFYMQQSTWGTSNAFVLQTNPLYRDPSSWYHVIIAVDTTQATDVNRIKLYINGVQVTSFSSTSYPSQNANLLINNNGTAQYISKVPGYSGDTYFDGYLAEINFVDGQQLTPSSFGSFNSATGVWQPAKYTGTYGTNGFYLPFNETSTASYAGAFNGSSQNLSFPNSSNFAFGTGAFTIEGWINSPTGTNNDFILGGRSAIGTMIVTTGGYGGTTTIGALRYVGSSEISSGNSLICTGSWNHFAITRDGSNNVKLYVNGVLSGSGTDTTNYTTTSGTWYVAVNDIASNSYLPGSLSNMRIVKGTAVYTSNFIPPSAPLTAISGTSLLTLQSSTIIDNSGNSVSITNTGSVAMSIANPFLGTNLASDQSGNNNNWTPNNISLASGSTYDSMTDVPTLTSATVANYCVMNPLNTYGSAGLSNGNLTYVGSGGAYASTVGSIAVSSGKWYWEVTVTTAAPSGNLIGISDTIYSYTASPAYIGQTATSYGYYNGGTKYNNASGTSYGASYTSGDVIGVALDLNAGTLTFYKNNTSQGTAFTGLSGTFIAGVSIYGAAGSMSVNFGQQPFVYTPPSGFVALNAYNLPTGTILAGNKYMDATLYTGNGGTQTITNAAGFQPDLVWLKARSNAYGHILEDSVRGALQYLASESTSAESTLAGSVSSFNSNGFSVGNQAGSNGSGVSLVGWQWQAGQGSTSSNTNGSITSTVSVNATAGFSVVTYTGTGANATVGHGLGVAPSLIICKSRNNTYNWVTYHSAVQSTPASSANYYLYLNTTDAATYSTAPWQGTAPTSSVFSVANGVSSNGSGTTIVAYCWAAIPGFSAFGSYTGNGSTTGPFIYTGFRPKFILWKCSTSAYDWDIYDTSRDPYNSAYHRLIPDSSGSEQTLSPPTVNILSNGFNLIYGYSSSNNNGDTYIYAAFAENPLKYSLAR